MEIKLLAFLGNNKNRKSEIINTGVNTYLYHVYIFYNITFIIVRYRYTKIRSKTK